MLANLLGRMRNAVMVSSLLFWSASALADFQLNMTPGVSSVSRQVYDLHMLIFWICVIIGIGVFGVMAYSIYHHRKSRGAVAAQFHESTAVELIWTVIPMLILIGMAIPATRTLIAMEDTSNPDMTVKVTGYQWKWQYEYLDDGISFFSNLSTPREEIANVAEKGEHYLLEVDQPLVLPVGKKVRILTTAADVIHSWWVPALGWKKDAIPGYVNESWTRIDKPGVYRGQCAELCGKDHGFMPIVVVAKAEDDYKKWMADMKGAQAAQVESAGREWNLAELKVKGEQVFTATCAACHQASGKGVPGVFPPVVAGEVFTAPDAMLEPLRQRGFLSDGNKIAIAPLEQHVKTVMHGIPGTAMQAFGNQLSDVEIAAVITYQRNAWGNNKGDFVQPKDIKALR
jgi:cytochrome c oxidase subunit 2